MWSNKKKPRHFFNPPIPNQKSIETLLHAFSRAWRWLQVFVSSSNWLIVSRCCDWSEQFFRFWFYGRTIRKVMAGEGGGGGGGSCMRELFSGLLAVHELFFSQFSFAWIFLGTPPLTFLMVRPLRRSNEMLCIPFPRGSPTRARLVCWLSTEQSLAQTSCLLDFD